MKIVLFLAVAVHRFPGSSGELMGMLVELVGVEVVVI